MPFVEPFKFLFCGCKYCAYWINLLLCGKWLRRYSTETLKHFKQFFLNCSSFSTRNKFPENNNLALMPMSINDAFCRSTFERSMQKLFSLDTGSSLGYISLLLTDLFINFLISSAIFGQSIWIMEMSNLNSRRKTRTT